MKNWKKILFIAFISILSAIKLVTLLKPTVDSLFQDSKQSYTISRGQGKVYSTHYGERTQPIRHIVIHSFSLPMDLMIKRLDELKISTHYLIDKNGKITNLVPEDKVAWHAGVSFWRGQQGLNATSIGIELQNDMLGQVPFSKEQIASFQILAKDIMYRYQIDPRNVVAHSDISPIRKVDVGAAFPWKKMAQNGIGIWPNDISDFNETIDERALLLQIGYDVTDIDKALLAFERHFMPELIPFDEDVGHWEENLVHQKPIRNAVVYRRLLSVSKAFK